MSYQQILAVEEWPDVPGHPGSTKIWNGKRKAVSDDGKHWLVKKDGWFHKWEWRPVNGMFVKLKEAVPSTKALGDADGDFK
jgi:hypothetical protein